MSVFAQRAQDARRSMLREILKLTEKPGVISFAGGLPDPETFPREVLAAIAAEEIRLNYRKSLQYTTTEGKRPLREKLSAWLSEDGIHYDMDELIIISASQQGLDLVAKTFLDPKDAVFVSLPTYLGAIQAFRAFQANLIGIPLLEDGMDLDALEEAIASVRAEGRSPKLIYVIPDFQNPTGISWSEDKRCRLLEIAAREGLIVVEDMPYRKLRYEGKPRSCLAGLDKERVIMLFTFSKLLAPGLRLGALGGPRELVEKIVVMKQATDLCTSSLVQRIAMRFLLEYDFSAHIQRLCYHYREKRDVMLSALDRYMPNDVSWTNPEGGLFLWMRLPHGMDTEQMFSRALANDVAYVPGAPFFVNGSGHNTIRLSFSEPTLEDIAEGIKRLGRVVEEELSAIRFSQAV